MKNIKIFGILLLIVSVVSCEKEEEKSQEEGQSLEVQFDEIQKMAESKTCTDGSDWGFTAHGHKACGGPVGYIAYPKKIKDQFLKKVESYSADQKAFNKKWGGFSTCDIPPSPESVDCVDGLPVLVY